MRFFRFVVSAALDLSERYSLSGKTTNRLPPRVKTDLDIACALLSKAYRPASGDAILNNRPVDPAQFSGSTRPADNCPTRAPNYAPLMPKKGPPTKSRKTETIPDVPKPPAARPSALLDTRVVYRGDNLEQLAKLPDHCVDLIYIDPPFNSNRNYEVFWGETKEKRVFEDRHASTQAYIDYMRPRCVQLARVLKKTAMFYHHRDWHAFGQKTSLGDNRWHQPSQAVRSFLQSSLPQIAVH